MRLFYFPICPISNKFRILAKLINIKLSEIKISSKKELEEIRNINFFFLPILIDGDRVFRDSSSILEYFNKVSNHSILRNWVENEEIQYMEVFFDKYMFFDVFKNSIYEKTEKFILTNDIFPNLEIVKLGFDLQNQYLKQLESLLKINDYIINSSCINNISCFCTLASLDYFFMISWEKYPNLKNWYRRMKSKSEYNFILNDRFSKINPPTHYNLIDF
ncbi:MAG: glutathione S-transferase N-terminal domain-containing protein [Bacteroidota bacterium]